MSTDHFSSPPRTADPPVDCNGGPCDLPGMRTRLADAFTPSRWPWPWQAVFGYALITVGIVGGVFLPWHC